LLFNDPPKTRAAGGGPGPCHGLTVYLGLETVVCGLVVDVASRVRPDHLTPPVGGRGLIARICPPTRMSRPSLISVAVMIVRRLTVHHDERR
jgi:hypothetical protein